MSGAERIARVGLGSNADAARQLARARGALAAELAVVRLGPELETTPMGGAGAPYHNQIVDVRTAATRDALVALLKRIEADLGRVRAPGAPVAIDLDLLAIEGEFEAQELVTAAHWRRCDLR